MIHQGAGRMVEKFVSYLRVSTDRQGRSGLGLEAQRAAVTEHIGSRSLVAEFVEVESGRRSDRPKLAEALNLCRAHRATLIIAKLDRLARHVAFVSNLMESGVEFTHDVFLHGSPFRAHLGTPAPHPLIGPQRGASSAVSQRARQTKGPAGVPGLPSLSGRF